jgi:hypothetical protein
MNADHCKRLLAYARGKVALVEVALSLGLTEEDVIRLIDRAASVGARSVLRELKRQGGQE